MQKLDDCSRPHLTLVFCQPVPELPDITIYIEALEKRIMGADLRHILITAPYLLKTVDPPLESVFGKKVVALRRLGKRICIGLEVDLWLVLHQMIAGRLHWAEKAKANARAMSVFEFSTGTLTLTEAGSRKRASLHLVRTEDNLLALAPNGAEISELDREQFAQALQSGNHTLKRALTDPHLFSGIGNAYSDEILWAAQLSPLALTQKLKTEEITRLYEATKNELARWTQRLRSETGSRFPEKVTAFREGMAVHGRFREPCPRCGNKVQRIRYVTNETNYCPHCQTSGRLLADRSLSRLLRDDWPKTPEELG